MITIVQRRLGRKIKLENSVELSSRESKAKLAKIKYRTKTKAATAEQDLSVQSLRDPSRYQKNKDISI